MERILQKNPAHVNRYGELFFQASQMHDDVKQALGNELNEVLA